MVDHTSRVIDTAQTTFKKVLHTEKWKFYGINCLKAMVFVIVYAGIKKLFRIQLNL